MKTQNLLISKQKLLDNKSLEKLSRMQPFLDHVQFMDLMIILLQISKDKLISCGITSSSFMTIVQPVSNLLKMLILESVF